jgi:iron complex outermembrane receptor protein
MMKRSPRAFHYALLCSAAITTFAMPAEAQPAPAATPTADADAGKVEKVTVTAQKRKQNAQDVPETVNAINGKNIKDLGITSSDRIAQYVPGVSINLPSGQGNQPIVSIRGIGNNDFNTNNTGPNGI